jgi:hypothetical protein
MSGYSSWRMVFLAALAIFWVAISIGINDYMVSQNYGEMWQIATALVAWWIGYLAIARVLYQG